MSDLRLPPCVGHATQMPEPAAWMRRWAADGIDVMSRPMLQRPRGWSFQAVTTHKLLPDDVPLFFGEDR